MTLHIVGLPHTETTRDWSSCAYTQKLVRLGGMLRSTGHRAILYAGHRNDGDYEEHVPIVTTEDRARWFVDETWRTRVFDRWDPADRCWTEMNDQAIAAIRRRIQPGDIIGIIAGQCQAQIAQAFPDHLALEWGVGYSGVLDQSFRVFESRAWAAHVAGRRFDDDFRAFDTVIPNSWDPAEFPELGTGQGGYLLFVGRLIWRKGPHVAAETARRLGMRLLVAGQGVGQTEPGRITCADGTVLEGDVEYVGVVGLAERAKLMGDAIATLSPTQYLEPFGGVAVESMLAGTPAIATAWGAFPETITHGETGYLCSTLAEFVLAARSAHTLERPAIRERALARFSTDVVRHQYAAYLDRLATLQGEGWYALEPEGALA